MSADERKFNQFRAFAEEKLQPDLEHQLEKRDRIYQNLAEYVELRAAIKLMQANALTEVDAQMNLGCDFYMQATIPDTSRIFVDVGLGFHAEFTLDEALSFIDSVETRLNGEADALSQSIGQLKVNLHLIYAGLSKSGE